MKHQPYREWMLNDGPRSEEQAAELKEHLAECASCRSLHRSWRGVRGMFDASASVPPPTGFVQRFELRMAAQRTAEDRQQVLLIFALSVVGSLGSALLLLDLASVGLVDGLAESLRTFMAARETIALVLGVLFDGVDRLSIAPVGLALVGLTIAVLGMITAVFAGLGGLWAAAVYRYAEPELTIGGSK